MSTRAALALALAVLAGGAAPSPARAAGAPSPTEAVRAHYWNVGARHYARAWDYVSPRTQRQLGGLADWRRRYRRMLAVSVARVRLLNQGPGLAELSFTLRTCRRARGGRRLVRSYRGRWDAAAGADGWRLSNPRLSRPTSGVRRRC